MPKIDLFNKTSDWNNIETAIEDGSFKLRSKAYIKYTAKSAAEGAIIGGVLGLALLGALVIAASALVPEEETTE